MAASLVLLPGVFALAKPGTGAPYECGAVSVSRDAKGRPRSGPPSAGHIHATIRATPNHLGDVFYLVGRQGVEP
jgi:hypothetical protein